MTVSDQIIQVLDNLCEKFGFAIDWTSENVVPYLTTLCTKLVSYEIWTSVAWMGILIIAFLAAFMLIRKYRSELGTLLEDEFYFVIIGIFSVVCAVGGIAAFIKQIMDIIKCFTFPEMFIFEYVQNIINSAS